MQKLASEAGLRKCWPTQRGAVQGASATGSSALALQQWQPRGFCPRSQASRLPASCTRSLQLGGRALHEGGFAQRTPTPTPELSSNNQSPRKRAVALRRAPGRHGPQGALRFLLGGSAE